MSGNDSPPNNPHDTDDEAAEFELKLGSIAAVLFAEAMSSVRLFGLGEKVGFAWYLAWLLPGALDVYALTMLRFQARVRHGHPLRAKAAREAILALIITVGCNALYEATGLFAAALPTWAPGALFVLVSALAPFVAGRIIHFQSAVGALRTTAVSGAPAPIAGPATLARTTPASAPHTAPPVGARTDALAPTAPAPQIAPHQTPDARITRTIAPSTPVDAAPAPSERTTPAPATRTTQPAPERIARLTPHPERARIIRALIAEHGADAVTGAMVGEALGVDRSNGYRALQRVLKENATQAHASPEKATEDEPETVEAAS